MFTNNHGNVDVSISFPKVIKTDTLKLQEVPVSGTMIQESTESGYVHYKYPAWSNLTGVVDDPEAWQSFLLARKVTSNLHL